MEAAELKAAEKDDDKAKEALNALKKSIIDKDIGNANVDTEITFEYGIRKLSEEEKKTAPKELKEAPFQLQITYTAQDGTKAVRVYTKQQLFTRDRKEAESNVMQQDLIFSNAAQKISGHALGSNVKAAKYKEKMSSKMASANNWNAPMMYQQQQQYIQSASSSTRAEEMNDEQANYFLKAKKINRKNMI